MRSCIQVYSTALTEEVKTLPAKWKSVNQMHVTTDKMFPRLDKLGEPSVPESTRVCQVLLDFNK